MSKFPETIDLDQLLKAIKHLESIEIFHLLRRGIKDGTRGLDFDLKHYREFRAWLDENTKVATKN